MSETKPYAKSLPEISPLTMPFWEAAKRHELIIQKCKSCGEYQFYPRAWCMHCGTRELEWVKTSGKGTVYSFVIIRQVVANSPAFQEDIPFVIAEVDLDEGPRVYGNLLDVKPEETQVGMRVRVKFQDATSETSLPKFSPIT